MTVRHFSVDAYIFLFILNTHLYICFFGPFFFFFKDKMSLTFILYSLFIEIRREMLCLTGFFFFCISIKCHIIGLLPSVDRFGGS